MNVMPDDVITLRSVFGTDVFVFWNIGSGTEREIVLSVGHMKKEIRRGVSTQACLLVWCEGIHCWAEVAKEGTSFNYKIQSKNFIFFLCVGGQSAVT